MTWFSNSQNIIWLGWVSGWLFIIGLPAAFLAGVLIAVGQIQPVWYVDPILNTIWSVLFVAFLFGIRGFAEKRADLDLVKIMNSLVIISSIQILLFGAYSLQRYFTQEFLMVVLLALFPLVCVYGVLLVRMADAFNKYVNEGVLFKRIVWWNRVAGWMMASFILCIPGILLSLVGEFFLWRLLAKETTVQEATPVSTPEQERVSHLF
jgi:hypothetical protein